MFADSMIGKTADSSIAISFFHKKGIPQGIK
jgi:hypothetical protein